MYLKSINCLLILLPTLRFMLAHCSLEPTDQFLDNPTDFKQEDTMTMHKRPSFFVGSRYGRSGSSATSSSSSAATAPLYATSKTRRLNVVPRNDRFFLSSRYGKRAGMMDAAKQYITPYEQALISEITTGTQLANKSTNSEINENLNNNDESSGSLAPSAASSLSAPVGQTTPYAYMSCIYTGLHNYYRCNSIIDMVLNNYSVNDVLNAVKAVKIHVNNNANVNNDVDDNDNDVADADDDRVNVISNVANTGANVNDLANLLDLFKHNYDDQNHDDYDYNEN